jgi:hypothetical protein
LRQLDVREGSPVGSDGGVFSVSDRSLAGTIATYGGGVAPDPEGRRVYFLASELAGGSNITLGAYDMDTLVLVGTETA